MENKNRSLRIIDSLNASQLYTEEHIKKILTPALHKKRED